MPLIESNAATVNKSGARKTPTICSAIGQTGDPATVSIQNNPLTSKLNRLLKLVKNTQ